MYQPHNVKPISTENNRYLIYYEETSWSLDEGPVAWRDIEEPLEVQSDDIDGHIKQLNIKNVEYIVEDYPEGVMPLIFEKLPAEEIESLIAYLKTLSKN